MADQDQVNRQENLNELFRDYQKGLTEASEFVGLLTSRTADLVDSYRNLAKASKQYGENEKQTAAALSQSAKLARSLQAPYDSIKSVSKDLEKSAKARVQLVNSLAAAEGKLSNSQEKSLTKLIQKRKILAERQAFEDKIASRLTEKQKQKVDAVEDERLAMKRAGEELLALEKAGFKKDDEVYKRAKAAEQLAEANYKTSKKSLSVDEKKYQKARGFTASARDAAEKLEAQLDPQAKMVLALREALGLHDKTIEYQEEELRRLENIEKAQSYYNMTLGLTADILDKVGAGRLKEAFGLQAGSEAAADAAKRLTDNGKKSLGVFGKLRVLFAGLGGALSAAFSNLMPGALIVKGVTQMVGYFKEGDQFLREMSGEVMDIATGLGVSTKNARELMKANQSLAFQVGVMPETLAQQIVELNQAFGTTQEFSQETRKTFAQLVNTMGYTTEEAANLVKISQLQGETVEDTVASQQAEVAVLNEKFGVAVSVKQVTQDIANASKATVLTLRAQGKSLGDAAFQARRLGLDLSKLESIGGNLLDFENSIAKEMEAELLIGRDLNLERAREAALRGDAAGVAAALASELGSAAEFGDMTVIQQEALAEALGMNRDTLAESLATQELLAGTNFSNIDDAADRVTELMKDGMSAEQARIALMEEGASVRLAERAADVSYDKQEQIRQRQREMAMADMADEFLKVAKRFRDIRDELIKLGTEFYSIFLDRNDGFITRLAGGVAETGMSFTEMIRGPVMTFGNLINKIANRIMDIYVRYGPNIKRLFGDLAELGLTIADTFMRFVTEFAGLNDPLDSANGELKFGKETLDSWSEAIQGAIQYIKDIDVKAISDSIHETLEGVHDTIESITGLVTNPTMKKLINAVGTGAALKLGFDIIRGTLGTIVNPMYVRMTGNSPLLEGDKSLAGAIRNMVTGKNGGFAGGTKLGRIGTGIAGRVGSAAPAFGAGATATSLSGLAAGAGGLAAVGFIGRGIYDVSQLDARSTSGETAQAKGGLGGAASGAAVGAAIGSLVPVVGTLLGAGIGAAVGYFGGRAVGAMEEFEDDLDKARRRRIQLTAQSEALAQSIEVQRERNRVDTLNNIYNTLEEVSGTRINIGQAFDIPQDQLVEAAKKFYAKGALTSEQFQDVIDGKINAAELVNITTTNAEIISQNVKEIQEDQLAKAREEAEKRAQQQFGVDEQRAGFLMTQFTAMGVDEEGDVNVDKLKASTFGQDLIKDLTTTFNNDIAEFNRRQRMDPEKARDLGNTTSFRFSGEQLGQYLEGEVGEQVQMGSSAYSAKINERNRVMLQNMKNVIVENFDLEAALGENEEAINATVAEILREMGSFGARTRGSKIGGFNAEEQAAELTEIASGIIANRLELFQAKKENLVEGELVNLKRSQANFVKYKKGYEEFYGTFNEQIGNIQEDADLAKKFVTNLTSQMEIDAAQLGMDKIDNGQIQTFLADAEGGLTMQEFINNLTVIAQAAAMDPAELMKNFGGRTFKVGDETKTFQHTKDGAAISNNGPFTITDKFGNAAITHPNDKLVVSPNVSYVNDGVLPGKKQNVFPVSEKFGALDVQVGKKGVMVQKVSDAMTGAEILDKYPEASSTYVWNDENIQYINRTKSLAYLANSSRLFNDLDDAGILGLSSHSGYTGGASFTGGFNRFRSLIRTYIRQAIGGDEQALDYIVDPYKPNIIRKLIKNYAPISPESYNKPSFYPDDVASPSSPNKASYDRGYRGFDQIIVSDPVVSQTVEDAISPTEIIKQYPADSYVWNEDNLLKINKRGSLATPANVQSLFNHLDDANILGLSSKSGYNGQKQFGGLTRFRAAIKEYLGLAIQGDRQALDYVIDPYKPEKARSALLNFNPRFPDGAPLFFPDDVADPQNPNKASYNKGYRGFDIEKVSDVRNIEDGFFGNIIDAVKGTFDYLANPEEILDNILKELGENARKIAAFVKSIFSSNAVKKPLLNTIKKVPFIGKAIDLAFLGYDINKISQEEGISPLEIYQGIGKRLFEFGGGLLGGIGGTALGGLISSALTVGTGGAGALLAPLITGSVSLIGGAFGEYLGGQLSTLFDSSSLGQLAWNSLTSQPQLVADGSAIASRGPFTITDKFGATAVTAKGDGVVVSPNISYVEDGITDATVSGVSQNTTVIESDNSKLEQEFAEMKQLMSKFIESVPALASRPISIELDGNKVGQALGQNSYRMQ